MWDFCSSQNVYYYKYICILIYLSSISSPSKLASEPCEVAHTWNSSTWEAKAGGGLQVQNHFWIHNKTLSQKKKTKKDGEWKKERKKTKKHQCQNLTAVHKRALSLSWAKPVSHYYNSPGPCPASKVPPSCLWWQFGVYGYIRGSSPQPRSLRPKRQAHLPCILWAPQRKCPWTAGSRSSESHCWRPG